MNWLVLERPLSVAARITQLTRDDVANKLFEHVPVNNPDADVLTIFIEAEAHFR